MSNYSEDNFGTVEEGLDYIFAYMGSVYGASFNRHWDGMDLQMVRDVWARTLGSFLTYQPSLDYALSRMDEDFPPSAIKFRNLCNAGPSIPMKPIMAITRQPTIHEQIKADEARAKAKQMLEEFKREKRHA